MEGADDNVVTRRSRPINGDNDGAESSVEFKPKRIRIPKRNIVVEPILVVFALAGYPMMLLSQQFIYKICQINNNATHINDTSGHSNCHENMTDDEKDLLQKVQKEASNLQMYLSVCQSLPTLFVTLFIGAYSDKKGRRIAILPPLFGSFVKALSLVLVIYLELPLWTLFIGSFIDGCGGGFATLLLGCFAYVSDITIPEKRAFRIIIVEMSMFLSAAVGPIGFNTWLHREQNYLYPFMVITGGYALAILYAIFFVPETVIKDPAVKTRFFSCSHIADTANLFIKDDEHKRRWKLIAFLMAFFPIAFITMGGMSIDTLFQMNAPLCWVDMQIGIYATVSIVIVTVSGATFAKLVKMFLSDEVLSIIGGFAAALGRFYTGFVANTFMMYVVPVISFPSLLCIPTIRTLMSKLVSENEQGAVFGALAFLEVLCSLLGGASLTQLYNATMHISSGFIFFIQAAIILLGCAILTITCVIIWRQKPPYHPLENMGEDESDAEDINPHQC